MKVIGSSPILSLFFSEKGEMEMIDTRTEKLSPLLKEEIERLRKERDDISNKLNDAKREVEILQKEWSYLDTLVVYLQDTQDLIDNKGKASIIYKDDKRLIYLKKNSKDSERKEGEINDAKSDSL